MSDSECPVWSSFECDVFIEYVDRDGEARFAQEITLPHHPFPGLRISFDMDATYDCEMSEVTWSCEHCKHWVECVPFSWLNGCPDLDGECGCCGLDIEQFTRRGWSVEEERRDEKRKFFDPQIHLPHGKRCRMEEPRDDSDGTVTIATIRRVRSCLLRERRLLGRHAKFAPLEKQHSLNLPIQAWNILEAAGIIKRGHVDVSALKFAISQRTLRRIRGCGPHWTSVIANWSTEHFGPALSDEKT